MAFACRVSRCVGRQVRRPAYLRPVRMDDFTPVGVQQKYYTSASSRLINSDVDTWLSSLDGPGVLSRFGLTSIMGSTLDEDDDGG